MPSKGYKQTVEHARMSAAQFKGRIHTPETRAKMSAASAARWREPEFRAQMSEAMTGDKNPNWTGGRSISTQGYVTITTVGGRRLEHRVVMEGIAGRSLLPREEVHHEDDNKRNNAPENLMLFPNKAAHQRYHNEKKGIPHVAGVEAALNA